MVYAWGIDVSANLNLGENRGENTKGETFWCEGKSWKHSVQFNIAQATWFWSLHPPLECINIE